MALESSREIDTLALIKWRDTIDKSLMHLNPNALIVLVSIAEYIEINI